MALLSPGVQVTVTDKSIYTATTSNTVPLFFIATKYGKTQPNSNTLAQGTIEAGVPRLVTSLRESIELFGVPIFYRDVYDQPYHGDCRNEYGLLALNQFLKVGSRAYVIRANIDLDDDVESLQLLWEKATVDAVNVAKQLAGQELSQRNNGDTAPEKQFLGGHELFTLTSDLIDTTTGELRTTADSTLTAAQKASIVAYHASVASKEYYNDILDEIVDVAIEEYSKSTSSFKDRYSNASNLKFNLSSVLGGNFYNTVSKDGSNPDGMKYTYFKYLDPIYSATLTGGAASSYTSDEKVKDILMQGARTIHTQVRTAISDILTNDSSKTNPFFGTKGLLESKFHPYSLGTVSVSYTTLPASLTLPLPSGYNDVLQITGHIKNVFVPPSDASLPNATTQSVAPAEYTISGARYQGTTIIGRFSGVIKNTAQNVLYAKEVTGNAFNFTNTDAKVFTIFYTDAISSITSNIGELTVAANTTSPLVGNGTSNFGGTVNITNFVNTKNGLSVTQFGSFVDTAFRDYIKTDSWYFVTHPKSALQSGNFNIATDNTDATRRLEVVRRLAQVIQDNASLNMDIKPEFGSDIASEGYEFTNFYDVSVGIDAYELLTKLGYEVILVEHEESGRAFISKGFLEQAKAIANINIDIFSNFISEDCQLIGIEPSAILTFRDEYIRLADDKEAAQKLSKNALTIEEFFKKEITSGKIHSEQFSDVEKVIKIHGHCHQKSLSSVEATFAMLNLPKNSSVTIYNSGCCGMAGSFGYEKEHYDVSMQMGEDTLFPKVRATHADTAISAAGTSCRHQIYDGTSRKALHPVTILRSCLN